MSGNGSGEGEPRTKKCPFVNGWCLGEACTLHMEMKQGGGGLQKKFSTCAFNALVVMISELNAKTQVPQQKITMPPKILRG